MALRDLITFNRAYDGIQKTVQNISSIRTARQKLEQKKELDDLTIKEKKLNIQKQSMANEMTQMEQGFLESQLKELEKVSKAETTAISGKIDIAEIGEKAKLGQLQDFAKVTGSRLDDNDVAVLMGLSSGKEAQPEYSDVARRLNPNLPSVSYKRKVGSFTISSGKKKTRTRSEIFDEGFRGAEAGKISFETLEREFPEKRKAIKEQRILGLPEKSQRLLNQINDEIKADAKSARKAGEISNPEDVIADFLGEIVANREQAERAGHDVNKILDILGVTEQEILDNQPEPQEGFLKKILDTASSLTILGSIKKISPDKKE